MTTADSAPYQEPSPGLPLPSQENEGRGRSCRFFWNEWANFLALLGLAAVYVGLSWRRWPDALVDFGRELYLPWRISEGAVLYRDVGHIYGPLSHYINAALFEWFGPGLMVLVSANLLVFTTILAVIYRLCRRAWGGGAAFGAGAVFISIFGFSQFVGIGNYNYAAPYSHETTHGLLVCLLLTHTLVRWVEAATVKRSLLAGFLFGLSAVLKPEILLAAACVTLAAKFARRMEPRPVPAKSAMAWLAGATLPTAAFTLCFACSMPLGQALGAACRGWLNVASKRVLLKTQMDFLGFDHPWMHLWQDACATVYAGLIVALIAAVAWQYERIGKPWLRRVLAASMMGAIAGLSFFCVHWIDAGQCLPGLILIYAALWALALWRRNPGGPNAGSAPKGLDLCGRLLRGPCTRDVAVARLLLATLGVVLLARMALNARLFQFGYYQAAIAAVVVTAGLIGELPGRLRLGSSGRTVLTAGMIALLAPGIATLSLRSARLLRLKTATVGEATDRFFIYPPNVSKVDELVRLVTGALKTRPEKETLLVLPDGLMINYLTRHPGPPLIAGDEPDEQVVKKLKMAPPDWVVFITFDLRPFGVERYGARIGEGKQIVDWVLANYGLAGKIGNDPLDPRQFGAAIYKSKNGG